MSVGENLIRSCLTNYHGNCTVLVNPIAIMIFFKDNGPVQFNIIYDIIILINHFIYNIKESIMSWEKDLKIKQVDEMIATLKTEQSLVKPKGGWIKLIRTTLGMSARALGDRVGLTQSRIALIEKGEINETITLQTLEKVADGLECKLVYFLVPKEKSLATLREKQAYKKALAVDSYAERQMTLEDQATSKQYQKENIEKLKNEYLRNWPQDFWDIK